VALEREVMSKWNFIDRLFVKASAERDTVFNAFLARNASYEAYLAKHERVNEIILAKNKLAVRRHRRARQAAP
jgi:hypothetical protein